MQSHGFKHGEHVVVKSTIDGVNFTEHATISYQDELGSWVLVYTTESGRPRRGPGGSDTIDFVHEIGWRAIEKWEPTANLT